MSKRIDRFQITGFIISTAIPIILVLAGQDTLPSVIVGLLLAALTQLFDLQARMTASRDSAESLIVEHAERIIRSLDGVELTPFTESHLFYSYVAKRIRKAKRTVDDMSLGHGEGEYTLEGQESLQRYFKTIPSVCSRKRKFTYREIMSFPSAAHSKRAEFMLSKNLPNYLLGWYRYPSDPVLPLLQFMVIDSEEVILGFYQPSGEKSIKRPIQMAVTHPDIVELFQDYYTTIWRRLEVVQDIATFRKLESSHDAGSDSGSRPDG